MKLRSKEENWESEMVNRTVKASFMVMGALAAMIDWWKENVGESVMLQCEIWSSEEHERENAREKKECAWKKNRENGEEGGESEWNEWSVLSKNVFFFSSFPFFGFIICLLLLAYSS